MDNVFESDEVIEQVIKHLLKCRTLVAVANDEASVTMFNQALEEIEVSPARTVRVAESLCHRIVDKLESLNQQLAIEFETEPADFQMVVSDCLEEGMGGNFEYLRPVLTKFSTNSENRSELVQLLLTIFSGI